MLREVVVLCVWALCLSSGNSQPVFCTGGEHCALGYFCDTEAKACRECVRCQELKRESLLNDDSCVTSIEKCGGCIKGFTVDHFGDLSAPCVEAETPEISNMQKYGWWIFGTLGFVFLALVIAIIVYIYLNPGVFKFGGNCENVRTNTMTVHRASAPDRPPPPYSAGDYNNHPYSTVRTDTPSSQMHEAGDTDFTADHPLIKHKSAVQPPGQRVPASSQGATVFNPAVVDYQEPSSPEIPNAPAYNDNFNNPEHTTMASTAGELSNEGGVSARVVPYSSVGGGGPATPSAGGAVPGLQEGAPATLVDVSPPELDRTAPTNSDSSNRDSTNSDNGQSHSGNPGQGNFSETHNGAPYLIINNVVQVVSK